MVKNMPVNAGDANLIPGWRRKWQPTPLFLPEKSNGQRNLAGYSPWGCKKSDRTEHTPNNKTTRKTIRCKKS